MTFRGVATNARRRMERHLAPFLAEGLPITMKQTRDGSRLTPNITMDPHWMSATNVRVSRNPHASEGETGLSIEFDVHRDDGDEIDRAIAAWLDPLVRLLRQDREIMAAGEDPTEAGARWHVGHPLIRAAARHWGWEREELVRPMYLDAPSRTVPLRDDGALRMDVLVAHPAGDRVELVLASRRRRLEVRHLSIMRGHHLLAQFTDALDEGAHLSIGEHRMPEATLAAMVGRRVREVAGDEALGPINDLTITSAANALDGRGVMLGVETGCVNVANGRAEAST